MSSYDTKTSHSKGLTTARGLPDLPIIMLLERKPILTVSLFSVVFILSTFVALPSTAATSFPALTTQKSTHWAGYGIVGPVGAPKITEVQGSFIQPKVTCNTALKLPQKADFLAAMDGVHGDAPLDFEYVGTSATCAVASATPTYHEVSAAAMAPILPIVPGHVYYASVAVTSVFTFHYTLKDVTTGKTSTGTANQANAVFNAAECIVDGHFLLSSGSQEPLANFGTVSFGKDFTKVANTCTATVSDQKPTAIGGFAAPFVLVKYVMYNSALSTIDANPSALTADLSSFKVTWLHAN
jgi:hypothetical protein